MIGNIALWFQRRLRLIAVLPFLILVGCTQTGSPVPAPGEAQPPVPGELRVMTHDSFAISEAALAAFENVHHVKVQFLKSGDTGSALNKAILAKDNPLADVFYGVDNTFLSRALTEEIFEPYTSPLLSEIPASFKLDAKNQALPVDYGDVCLNYDIAFLEGLGVPPPSTLVDLAQPEYKRLLVVQNPASSSPGLAFLLTTIAEFGEDGYLEYWKSLVNNDVQIVDGWETAYYTGFSGSSGRGPRPIVVSYNSSPVFELIFAETPMEAPPTAAVVAPNTCFRQIEFVGILKGARNRELAEQWVDFMLSSTFQSDLPLQMFVFPVNQGVQLGETFEKFLQFADQPVLLNPQVIAQNREKWLSEWTETVLRRKPD